MEKYVLKRNGKKEQFNPDKIKNAVKAAFNSLGYSVDDYDEIVNSIKVWDEMSIEDIQDQVIEVLRDFGYNDVADCYLIYRYKHKILRDFAQNKWDYICIFEKFYDI